MYTKGESTLVTQTKILEYVGQIDGILVSLREQSGLSLGEKRELSACIAIVRLISEVVSNDYPPARPGLKIIRSSTKAQDFVGKPDIPHRNPSRSLDLDLELDPRTDADRASGGRYSNNPPDDSEF